MAKKNYHFFIFEKCDGMTHIHLKNKNLKIKIYNSEIDRIKYYNFKFT